MRKLKEVSFKRRFFIIIDIGLMVLVFMLLILTKSPATVKGLTVEDSTYDTVYLSWNETEGAARYNILRKEDSNYEFIGSTEKTSFTDKDLETGKTYTYKIESANGIKRGKGEEVKATTTLEVPKVSADISDGKINLTISKVNGAKGYGIVRDGKEIQVTQGTSFTDSSAIADTAYEYQVKAYRDSAESNLSEAIKTKLVSVGEIKTEIKSDDLVVSWDDNYTSYKVFNGDELLAETSDSKVTVSAEVGEYDLKVVGYGDVQSPATERTFSIKEVPMDNATAIQNAIDWAVDIANDNSFNYGKKGTNGPGYANRCGCYFCGTNDKKVKLSGDKRYYKTWPCMPFITAVYAHGAKDPEVLKTCKRCGTLETNDNNWKKYTCWEFVGRMSDLTVDDLKPGDVLVHYDEKNGASENGGHMSMYIGNGDIVDSSGGGWGANSIAVRKNKAASYLKAKWNQTPSKNYVMRYIGNGSGKMKVIE